jgi:3-oxoacyl-[acyl-carrier-protein] synthase II
VGIVHATTRGDLELIRRRYLEFESVKPRRAYVESSWTTPSGLAMIEHGFTGPAVVASAACSSGGHALAVAHRLLACGDATDVIVVASDIGFDGEEITFFASLGPLHYDRQSTEVCRPFQEGSEGFVLGEAAAAIVLSAGAAGSPHASLLASELGNDHHHPVSIEPSGVEIQRTIDRALQRARIDRSGVEHYSAHGTGTAECSRADAIALASIGTHPTAHAFKPMVGHTMGAAPMVDAVVNVLVHDRGYVPAPLPAFEVETHPQLASGVVHHTGGATVQLGLGFGSNISVLVWGDAPAAS